MSYYFPTPDEFSRHTVFGNVRVTTLAGEHVQISLADIPADGVVGEHAHPNEQVGLMLDGEAAFTIGGETKLLKPGDVFRIPGGVLHSVVPVNGPVRAIDIFYPIRDEYR
jgi:quercetin dioxygenase-like cupin family protein